MLSLRSQKPDLHRQCIWRTVNVGQRYNTIKSDWQFAEARAHRDRDGDKIVDRGRVQSLARWKTEKKARGARLLSFMRPFFRLCIERETRRVCLFPREERRTRRIDRAFYWRAGLVLWKRHNFLHPTSDVAHTLVLLYARKNVRRARSEFATQSDFTLYKHPISPLRIMRYNIPGTLSSVSLIILRLEAASRYHQVCNELRKALNTPAFVDLFLYKLPSPQESFHLRDPSRDENKSN